MVTSCVTDTSHEPLTGDIELTLGYLLESKNLRLSERNRRFLSFVVSEKLAGRAHRIKAYSIGIDVFGRPDNFNPSIDPIVRIEATRLRSALACYYDGPGAGDEIRITLPPGGYVPRFERRGELSGKTLNAAKQSRILNPVKCSPSSIVLQHLTDPDHRHALNCGELLIDTIIVLLCKHGFNLFVMPSLKGGSTQQPGKHKHHPVSGALLELNVHTFADGQRYSWRISTLQDSLIRFAGYCDHSISEAPSGPTIDGIAQQILRALET